MYMNFDSFAYDGIVPNIDHLAYYMEVEPSAIASIAGLSSQQVTQIRRKASPSAQARLRELIELFELLAPHVDSVAEIIDFVTHHPIADCGNRTVAEMFNHGDSLRCVLAVTARLHPNRYASCGTTEQAAS